METKRKTPDQISDEELFEALKREDKDEDLVANLQNDAINFIVRFGIKPGSFKVQLKLLYHIYKNWSQSPMNMTTFNYNIRLYVPASSWYRVKINMSAFKFTEHAYKILKHELKKKKDFVAGRKVHFEAFLRHYELKSPAARVGRLGADRINFATIYWLYDKFCYDKGLKKHILTYRELKGFMKMYFEHRINPNKPESFYVKKTPVTKDQSRKALEWYRGLRKNNEKERIQKEKDKRKRKREKNAKKRNKVPSIEG